MGRFTSIWESIYPKIRNDIYALCDLLNFIPTAQQRRVLNAVVRAQYGVGKRRIAVRSGQGPGKTALSNIVALWRALQHVGSMCIVTAPTLKQCKDNWLAEFRRLIIRAHPLIQQFVEVTTTKIIINCDPNWTIKLETATKAENFAGKHEKHLMYIMDEASGIPREIWEVIKGTLTNKDAMCLAIGNPTTRDGVFFECFTSQRALWECIQLNGEETPASEWFDPRRNRELEEEYGRNSDVYRVRVLGEFPHSDPNTVVGIEDLEPCTNSRLVYNAARIPRFVGTSLAGPAKQFGIDIARFGSDESVIMRRAGNAIVEWEFFAKCEPATVIDNAFKMQYLAHWRDDETWYVADANGLGGGVMHKFYQTENGAAQKNVLEFLNHAKPMDSNFADKITEAWFHLGKLAKSRQIYLPNDNRLIQQLCTRQYHLNKKNKIRIEDKETYCKRGHDSPDRADALVMAFYDEVLVSGNVSTSRDLSETSGGKVIHEYLGERAA